jgi:MurNAc alpha-1-phosphate uridylyltransferase
VSAANNDTLVAMVLAAGLGKRMRPLTQTRPKPLIKVADRTLLDRGLDALVRGGVGRAVVNVHYLGGQIAAHLDTRNDIRCEISDETDLLLESAGGIVRALPRLGAKPFVILNADTFWVGDHPPAIARLAAAFDPGRMDMLLLLADPARATGHSGGMDFAMDGDGKLVRMAMVNAGAKGHIYAGAAIVSPSLFDGAGPEPHSLNLHFDRMIAGQRLFGQVLDGHWITVGTPDAIPAAERAIADHGGRGRG